MSTHRAWTPSRDRQANSQCAAFIEAINRAEGEQICDFESLHAFSIQRPERFWAHVWQFCGIVAESDWSSVLDGAEQMIGASWFVGARLNFAANLLKFRGQRTALLYVDEQGHRVQLTYEQLYKEVERVAAGLSDLGVGPGDRVACYMPNRPETVVAMLAATSLGAVFSSCSTDFGVGGVMERFGQIDPKVIFCTEASFYNGKRFDLRSRNREIVDGQVNLRRAIVIRSGEFDDEPDRRIFEDYASFGRRDRPLKFESLPFNHPLYILYSSGTTGPPKCIVHGAGGTLIQHLKELVLHTDITRDDRVFYYTTCGWMMWNWMISSLAVGASVVLYDGSPMFPSPESMWDVVDAEGVTVFGTSAKYLSALQKAGAHPKNTHDLSSLRTILSTGSPLLPASYDFVYEQIKEDVMLASISGGTDIVSCFALGAPLKPVYRGQLQCLGLGMDVRVLDDDGQDMPPGHAGELACVKPFPSMPIGFLNDPDGSRYKDAYFARFNDTWCHGDWAELTAEGGLIIHGRSDATLNPGGVRIGTAEIYRQMEVIPEVVESVVVGQQWQGDVRVILFVRLQSDATLDEALIDRIRVQIRKNTTPRHVPARIIVVKDIPRTLSGKIVELAVRDAIHGRKVKNLEALANPESLEHFRGLTELAS